MNSVVIESDDFRGSFCCDDPIASKVSSDVSHNIMSLMGEGLVVSMWHTPSNA